MSLIIINIPQHHMRTKKANNHTFLSTNNGFPIKNVRLKIARFIYSVEESYMGTFTLMTNTTTVRRKTVPGHKTI
jgi:hypothetical protein